MARLRSALSLRMLCAVGIGPSQGAAKSLSLARSRPFRCAPAVGEAHPPGPSKPGTKHSQGMPPFGVGAPGSRSAPCLLPHTTKPVESKGNSVASSGVAHRPDQTTMPLPTLLSVAAVAGVFLASQPGGISCWLPSEGLTLITGRLLLCCVALCTSSGGDRTFVQALPRSCVIGLRFCVCCLRPSMRC